MPEKKKRRKKKNESSAEHIVPGLQYVHILRSEWWVGGKKHKEHSRLRMQSINSNHHMWWCLFQSDPPGIGFDDNDKCDAELQVLMKYKSRFWQDWIWIIHFTGVTPCLSQLLLIYLCTLKHEHPAGKKREPQQRHWTEERSKNRSPRWNEPLWRRLTDRLFELQRAVYLAAAKKRKKRKRNKISTGLVSHTSPASSLILRQRRWPVSPWCDALIYVTPSPPLSSGRAVTTGWGQEKHKLVYKKKHQHNFFMCNLLQWCRTEC